MVAYLPVWLPQYTFRIPSEFLQGGLRGRIQCSACYSITSIRRCLNSKTNLRPADQPQTSRHLVLWDSNDKGYGSHDGVSNKRSCENYFVKVHQNFGFECHQLRSTQVHLNHYWIYRNQSHMDYTGTFNSSNQNNQDDRHHLFWVEEPQKEPYIDKVCIYAVRWTSGQCVEEIRKMIQCRKSSNTPGLFM